MRESTRWWQLPIPHAISRRLSVSLLPLIVDMMILVVLLPDKLRVVGAAEPPPKFPSSPCTTTYPSYSERRECGLPSGPRRLLNGWLCDPDNTISMSELYVIDDTLQRIYSQYGDTCACPTMEPVDEKEPAAEENDGGGEEDKPCWYKFAFAFMRHLHGMNDRCDPGGNGTTPQSMGDDLTLRAQRYAQAIRQKWAVGECGEDLLVLVVNQAPTPSMYLSWGPLIAEKLAVSSAAIGGSYTASNIADSIKSVLDGANAQLRGRYPLNRVLNSWLLKMVDLLRRLDARSNSPHPRSHIPTWAWGVFAACGIAFALMATGLCLLRSPNRRGNQRGKSNTDTSRRWKAGFVGDDAPPEAKTYVNLVQLMMPHPRPVINQPQQM